MTSNKNTVQAIVPKLKEEDEFDEAPVDRQSSFVSDRGYRRYLSVGDGAFSPGAQVAGIDRYYSEIELGQDNDPAAMSRHAHTMQGQMRQNPTDARYYAMNQLMHDAQKSSDPAEMSRHRSALMLPRTSSFQLTDHASFLGIRNPSSMHIDITGDGGKVLTISPPPSEALEKVPKSYTEKIVYMIEPYLENFMRGAKWWYKALIIFFLILNPIVFPFQPVVAGWFLLIEFVLTLALAVQNYPLEPGGLLAFEAICIGMTSAESVIHEIEASLDVVLLLIFMVAATHFMKRMLLFAFASILLSIKNKILVSIAFACLIGLLSAFLDALTVAAVMISVTLGYIGIYNDHRDLDLEKEGVLAATPQVERVDEESQTKDIDTTDGAITATEDRYETEREGFYAFLRDILIHGIVATAWGGAITSVGEPENLVVAGKANWGFDEFFYRLVAVTFPVMAIAIVVLVFVEKTKYFGFGNQIPPSVRDILLQYRDGEVAKMTRVDRANLRIQVLVALFIVAALVFQLAPVGIIGLGAIILVTTLNGITEEHDIGKAFQDSLPFLSLLVVFFAIVAVIDTQKMFNPILNWILDMDSYFMQVGVIYLINGVLSMVSDNVFVSTVFINELTTQFCHGAVDRQTYDRLSVSILSGVNILGIGTPNGQAAFLFLLTSHLSPIIKLSYMKMLWMCVPYTIMLTVMGLVTNLYLVPLSAAYFIDNGTIPDHLDDLEELCKMCGDLAAECIGEVSEAVGGH